MKFSIIIYRDKYGVVTMAEDEKQEVNETHRLAKKDANKIDKRIKALWKLWKAGIIDTNTYFTRREKWAMQRRFIHDMYGV